MIATPGRISPWPMREGEQIRLANPPPIERDDKTKRRKKRKAQKAARKRNRR